MTDTFNVIWGRREYRVRVVSYSINGGCVEVSPSYAHGGIPGEAAFVEDIVLQDADSDEPLPFDFYEIDDDEQVAIEMALLED